MTVWQLSEADSGRKVTLAPGDQVVITLSEKPTTGYRWEVTSPLPDVVTLVESHYSPKPTGGVGAGGARRVGFRATAVGVTTIVLACRRPWEPDETFVSEFRLSVLVRQPLV